MIKNIAKIDGMMCGMCEAHICDTIRKAFPEAKKVAASHTKGEAVFYIEQSVPAHELARAIKATGYSFLSLSSEKAEKKGFFSKFKK